MLMFLYFNKKTTLATAANDDSFIQMLFDKDGECVILREIDFLSKIC